ncbi:MAG: hypothetical protein ABIT20_14980 [Gemmatimonadaceae bacterium]
MRSYDVAIAALATRASRKWIDNLLTQHSIHDVISARRGIARRITHPALIRIALIRQLHIKLGVSVADGVRIAAHLLDSGPRRVYESGQLTLTVDLEQLERQLGDQLANVLESAPTPRRGRPSTKPRT